MGSFYYLVAQLPDISGIGEKAALPITEKYYRDLCSRFFSEKERETLGVLSLVPPREDVATGSAFLDDWYKKERALRAALAQVRAQRLHKEGNSTSSVAADILQAARTAVGMDSPLSAERFLYEWRRGVLDAMRPQDMFSFDSVMEYGVRLMLEARMRLFDKESGSVAYKTIYDSILLVASQPPVQLAGIKGEAI